MAITNPSVTGISAGGQAVARPITGWFPRLLLENAQVLAPPGLGNWTRGDMRMTVTTTAGSNVVTRTAGAPMSDAGTGAWMGVLRDGDVHRVVNVVSSAGNDLTLVQAVATTGVMELGSYHEAALGQHVSPIGGVALADLIFDADPFQLAAPTALFDADSQRGTWYATPWVSPFFSPQFWRQFGGLANNMLTMGSVQNMFEPTASIFTGSVINTATATCSGVGQGMEEVIAVSGPGLMALTFGHGRSGSLANTVRLSVLADGVQIHQSDWNAGLRRAVVPFGNCSELRVRVTALQASATMISVSRIQILDYPVALSAAVNPGDRMLVIGDSWVDESFRPEVVTRLRARAAQIGATVLPSVGVGGTQATYALEAVSGRRRIDSWLDAARPSVVLIHYYINDYNASVSAQAWAANISELVRTCLARSIRPLVILPGCTASSSQTQGMAQAYGNRLGVSAVSRVSITEALQPEISAVGAFVNTVQKTPGRAIRNSTNSAIYVARGSAAADPWDCITPAATPATITPA
jgi:hypothetical protein